MIGRSIVGWKYGDAGAKQAAEKGQGLKPTLI
jgi:hypothetical protein